MAEYATLRGKVTAYPEQEKGLVEVQIGAFDSKRNTVQARAGQSMSGVYWLPEIGDVVEVELPQLPGYEARIVHIHRKKQDAQTKTCWNKENNVKQLRSRSGHTITLDDTKEKEKLTLHTAGGLELILEDQNQTVSIRKDKQENPVLTLDMKQQQVKLDGGKDLTITCGGSTIHMDSEGNLSIQAKGKLELSGKSITLKAKGTLEGKGEKVELQGSMSAQIQGKDQLKLTSGGVAQVKGSVVKLN